MPTLDWLGKDKIINHHQEVPFRVLEKRYSFGDDPCEGSPAGGNMIVKGDNLEALKALLPRYEGRVKCVYIDPPYNTGNEGWVYNDNVNDPQDRPLAWAGRGARARGPLPPRQVALYDVPEAEAPSPAPVGGRGHLHQHRR